MTNPVSRNNIGTVLPPIQVPIADENGTINTEWYHFFLGLWTRTGGAQGAGNTDAAFLAAQAYSLAQTADSEAKTAQAQILSASTLATDALNEAESALALAQNVSQSNASMLKIANLSDVVSIVSARSNLHINDFPISFYGETPSNYSIYYPVARPLIIPANFTCISYCAVPPTSNAVCLLKSIKAGTGAVVTIGSITLTAGSYSANTVSATTAATLGTGDVVQLQLPTTDAQYLGISIRAQLA